MNLFLWVMLCIQVVGIVSKLYLIGAGKYPRTGTTSISTAVIVTVLNLGLLAWVIVLLSK